ncbi:MAG: MarR family winged helix-turn-helix transcriptional regulator [Candidatus Dormibacteria bacterium]
MTDVEIEDAAPDAPPLEEFQPDAAGRLFNPRLREVFGRGRVDAEVVCDSEAAWALVTAAKALQQVFDDSLGQLGISHSQFKALMWIRECGRTGSQLNAIASWLRVTPRNITGLVDGLEAHGLVERVPDPTDRRAVIARLTEAGEVKAAAARRLHHRNLKAAMASLEPDEKALLRHLSLKLLRDAEIGSAGRSRTNG